MSKKAKLYRDYINSLTFVPGNCLVCRQNGVKIRQLWCNKHNFCLICAEFVQRFQHGDFSCKICPLENMQVNSEKSAIERKPRRQRKQLPTPEIDQLIGLNDSDDDCDIEGNNQEWDKLLESLTKPASPVRKTPEKMHIEIYQPKPLTKKTSFLHLSLPSAKENAIETSGRRPLPNTNLICRTVTELLNSSEGITLPGASFRQATVKPDISEPNPTGSHEQQPIMREHELVVVSDDTLSAESPELERNTSPCKGLRPRSFQSISNESCRQLTSPGSESDEFSGLIGDSEVPEVDSSSSSRSGTYRSTRSNEKRQAFDDFWDIKVG